MLKKPNSYYFIYHLSIVLAVAPLLLSSCVVTPSAGILKSDAHSNPLYGALLVGELVVSSNTSLVKLSHDLLTVALLRKDIPPSPAKISFPRLRIQENQRKGNVIVVPFVLELAPGKYDLRNLCISRYIPQYGRIDDFCFSPREELNVPQMLFSVPENSIVSLGKIEVTILQSKITIEGVGTPRTKRHHTYKYKMHFVNQQFDDHKESLAYLGHQFPALFERYKDNVVLVRN